MRFGSLFTALLALGLLLPQSTLAQSASAQAPLTDPYQKGGGRNLVVNGRSLPRDLVFRFMPVTLPLANIRVTSLYGMRKHPVLGYNKVHPGVDFGGATGTPAFSTAAGVVRFAGWMSSYGNMVEVEHGLGFSTRYGHLSDIRVTVGQGIDRNALIGLVGATGRVTGPHLHYEIRHNGAPLDPIAFVLKAYEIYHHLD